MGSLLMQLIFLENGTGLSVERLGVLLSIPVVTDSDLGPETYYPE
jgi:hypothetical protein